MKKIARILTSLIIQIEFGFTKTGRVAHRTSTITDLRADVTEEEIRDFVEYLHLIMAGRITSVKLVQDTIYEVWTPETRKEKLEEKLAVAGKETTEAQPMPASRQTTAGQVSQNMLGAGFIHEEATFTPSEAEEVNTMHRANAPGTSRSRRNPIDADNVSKKPASQPGKTVKVPHISCIGGDVLKQLKQNDYKCTKEELEAWMSWSPHRDITGHEANTAPFKDLDPLIYGQPLSPGLMRL